MSAASVNATVELEVEQEREGGAQCLKVAGRNKSRLLCQCI